jgi:hypothetical protein
MQTSAWFWLIVVVTLCRVFPGVRDLGMNLLDLSLCLLPVVAEFNLAAHTALIPGQPLFVLLEAFEGSNKVSIAHGGEAGNAQVPYL